MKIKYIKISNLWGSYNVEWHLEEDVNVLAGRNGEGKSTLLSLACQALYGEIMSTYIDMISGIEIGLCDGTKIVNKIERLDLSDLLSDSKKYKDIPPAFLDRVLSHAQISYGNKPELIVPSDVFIIYDKDGNVLDSASCNFDESIFVVSTFDSNKATSLYDTERKIRNENEIVTDMDILLKGLLDQYGYYQADISKQVEHLANAGSAVDAARIAALYSKKNQFISILEKFFAETGKTVNKEVSNLAFIIQSNGSQKNIKPYNLSSGEKQLLYILLTVLLQNGRECVLFMDEPEISLHTDWQESLISAIRDLNPNCQLIIATHSPSMIIDGWAGKVQQIEKLKTHVG